METSQSAFLEAMRLQFDFGPFPRTPLDESPKHETEGLFIHNLVTPYYLRHQRVIDTKDKVILDAGCGTGYKALMLAEANPGAHVVGVDISPKSIELAQQRLEYHGFKDAVEFHVLAIEDLPHLGMSFDYINCDEVLYFFDDIILGLAALKAVLKPEGIIRTNLHSAFQRQPYFRAQELFSLMGLMELGAEEMAIPIVIETMKGLKGGVDLKKNGWFPQNEEPENVETVLANHLLKGDRGYRIADLFSALQQTELEFLSMTNWRHWEVADLFNDPDDLPAYLAMGLANSTVQDQLTIYELLHPVHRLYDFWCVHPSSTSSPLPLSEWDRAMWATAQVSLHPQLRTDSFREAAKVAIYGRQLLTISEHLSLPTLKPCSVDSSVAALLLGLFNGPMSFEDLVSYWHTLRGVDWVTLAPISLDLAQQQVIEIVSTLEVFLYVLVEPGYTPVLSP